jgi:hypothetical protein
MTDHTDPPGPDDPLDELATELLGCGAVLSQIIAHMVEAAAGASNGELVPIPAVAHSLIRDVIDGLGEGHTDKDVRVATGIVRQATDAICGDLLIGSPELN